MDTATRGTARELPKTARTYGSSIFRVARNFLAADSNAPVLAIAELFQASPSLPAIGVTDGAGRALGAVSREGLFSLLGKPFGREILKKRPIAEVVEPARAFNLHENIFAVAQAVDLPALEDRVAWFLLTDEEGRLRGIFSNQELLARLSRLQREDIELAATLQARLLGEAPAASGPGWTYRAWSRNAKGVGGDFHFHRALGGGRSFFTICDVSGKGVAASVISSMAWGMLRTFDFSLGLGALVRALNEAVVSAFHLEKYLTGLFLVLDEARARVLCADMGHAHACIVRGGKVHGLKGPTPNLPVGIDPSIAPNVFSFSPKPGDLLFAYSDGIVEQENGRGEEFAGERLHRILLAESGAPLSPATLVEAIPEAVDAFRGETPQLDDMSFIGLKFT